MKKTKTNPKTVQIMAFANIVNCTKARSWVDNPTFMTFEGRELDDPDQVPFDESLKILTSCGKKSPSS